MPTVSDGPRREDEALRVAKTVLDIYADATAALLDRIARRLADGVQRSDWQQRKAEELLRLRESAQRIVDQLNAGPERARQVVDDAYQSGVLDTSAALEDAGVQATNQRAVAALARDIHPPAADVEKRLQATHPRILRWTEDTYRSVIAEAVGRVAAGQATQRDAAQLALDRFAAAGVSGFTDTSGQSWHLESYVEMAVRTGAARAHVQGALDRLGAGGRDLVIVSDVPEECPLCRPWEGEVLSTDGMRVGQRVEGRGRSWFQVTATLAGARARGLLHPNCRHSLGTFVEGLTRRIENTPDPDGAGERAEQRRLERDVRSAKRRVAAAEPFGDTQHTRRTKRDLTEAQRRVREFVRDRDRKRLYHREQVTGPDRPEPTDAGAAEPEPSFTDVSSADYQEAHLAAPGNAKIDSVYTGRDIIDGDLGFTHVNTALRTGELPPISPEGRRTTADAIERIDAQFDTAPTFTEGVLLHRGVSDATALFGEPGSKVGQTFEDDAYVSTSIDQSNIEAYAKDPSRASPTDPLGIRKLRNFVTVEVPAGSSYLYGERSQGEYVLGRGAQFRVVGDELDEQGDRQIRLRYVGRTPRTLDFDTGPNRDEPTDAGAAEPELPGPVEQALRRSVPDLSEAEAYESMPDLDLPDYQRNALGEYTAFGHQGVNATLRGRQQPDFRSQEMRRALDDIFQDVGSTTQDVLVWRGVNNADEVFGEVGSEMQDPGFISTSLSREITRGFAVGEQAATARVLIPAGTKAVAMDKALGTSGRPSESEILLPRDSRFMVIEDEEVDGQRRITLSLVQEEQ